MMTIMMLITIILILITHAMYNIPWTETIYHKIIKHMLFTSKYLRINKLKDLLNIKYNTIMDIECYLFIYWCLFTPYILSISIGIIQIISIEVLINKSRKKDTNESM